MIIIDEYNIVDGEQKYKDFVEGKSEPFYSGLFNAIANADMDNIKKLTRVYRGEVYAYEKHVQTGRSIFKNLDEELEPITEYHNTIEEMKRSKKFDENEINESITCVKNLYTSMVVSEKYKDVEENVFVTW